MPLFARGVFIGRAAPGQTEPWWRDGPRLWSLQDPLSWLFQPLVAAG